MYTFNIIDEHIYNKKKDIALNFTTKMFFVGDNIYNVTKYTYFEVWMLLSSHCKIRNANNEFELYEGDLLVFSENDNINIISSDNNVAFLILKIDSSSFSEILPYNDLIFERNFFQSHSRQFKNKIPATNPTSKFIKDTFNTMTDIFSAKLPGYEIEALQQTLGIILAILRETEYHTENQHSDSEIVFSKTHKSLKKAIDYIDSHLNDELSLEKISSIAELSPNYFSNIFREQTGVKLWDYIGEKRILLATQLLIEYPNDSIISIALKCGFNNCPNFNRAFKKFTGQTPKKYKTAILRQGENE